LDFDTNRLFGNITPTLASLASRNVISNDRQNCARYIQQKKYEYLKDQRYIQRMASLSQQTQSDHNMAESLDRDWFHAPLHAEQVYLSPATLPPYSTTLVNLRDRKSSLRQLEKDAVQLRRAEQSARLDLRLHHRAGARAIRNIMVAEETKEMWRQRCHLDSPSDGGLTILEVQSNGDFSNNHCRDCTSWSVLTDLVEIRRALICRNRLHFGQAHGTFPTVPPLSNAVGWTASTPEADDI
jgi:hypothetical protein